MSRSDELGSKRSNRGNITSGTSAIKARPRGADEVEDLSYRSKATIFLNVSSDMTRTLTSHAVQAASYPS